MKLAKATVESAKGDDIHLKIKVQFLFPGVRVTSKKFSFIPLEKKRKYASFENRNEEEARRASYIV